MFRGLGVVLLRGGLFSRRQPGRQHPLEGLFLDAHMFQLPGQEVLPCRTRAMRRFFSRRMRRQRK